MKVKKVSSKLPICFRLSPKAIEILNNLAERGGTTKTNVMEAMIRVHAESEFVLQPKRVGKTTAK